MLSSANADPATQVSGMRGSGSCIGFMVDGVPQQELTTRDVDAMIPAENVGAMEYYRASEVPPGWKAEVPSLDTLPTNGTLPLPAQTGAGARPGSAPSRGPTTAGAQPPQSPTVSPSPQLRIVYRQSCDLIAVWTKSRLGLEKNGRRGGAGDMATAVGRAVFPDPLACEVRAPDDSLSLPVHATLVATGARAVSDTAWPGYMDAVLGAVRGAYVLPSDIGMSAFGPPVRFTRVVATVRQRPADTMLGIAPAFSTVISFDLDSTGAATGDLLTASSLSGAADTSALAAVAEAAFARAFPPMPTSLSDRGRVHFALVLSTTEPPVGVRSFTVGQVLVPVWELRRPAAVAPDSQPDLDLDALPAGAPSDSTILEFVVDERGHPVMSTARVVSARTDSADGPGHHMLVSRVVHALPRLVFTPALIGACPVRATVTQIFVAKPR